jgi:hypothetical protein
MGATTFTVTSVQGCWPRTDTDLRPEFSRESPPRVKGSKTQVPLSAMAFDSYAASDRNANESLILRLKTHARNLCLFWQAK